MLVPLARALDEDDDDGTCEGRGVFEVGEHGEKEDGPRRIGDSL
jgi:hypothetical protein